MNGPYAIGLDFDSEGDPPQVFIVDKNGAVVIEVFEEPTQIDPDALDWFDHANWKPGPFALKVLELLNG